MCGMPRRRSALASGFSARMTFPTTARSGFAASRFAAAYGVYVLIRHSASLSDMGG